MTLPTPAESHLQPDQAEPRRHNNFGLLRLVLAVLVLISHCFQLTRGDNASDPLSVWTGGQLTFGLAAVYVFFLVSGYLVTLSWLQTPSAGEFALKRVRRIYPGYLVAFAFSFTVGAIGSGPYIDQYLTAPYFRTDDVFRAIAFADHSLMFDTVAFSGNPVPYIVNGSVWTLQPELMCYALVLVLGLVGRRFGRLGILILLAVNYGLVVVNEIHLGGSGQVSWRLCTYFLVGAAAARYGVPRLTIVRVVLALAALVVAAGVPHAFTLVFPVAGAYLAFAVSFAPFRPWASVFARIDLSYGIYLYAFPIQQLVVLAGVRSPGLLFAAVLPLTFVAACVSWWFVESPALIAGRPQTHKTPPNRKDSEASC